MCAPVDIPAGTKHVEISLIGISVRLFKILQVIGKSPWVSFKNTSRCSSNLGGLFSQYSKTSCCILSKFSKSNF